MESVAIDNPLWREMLSQLPALDWESGPWIAGGSARKLLQGKDWRSGDVDVFFSSVDQMRSYASQLEQALIKPMDVNSWEWALGVALKAPGQLVRKISGKTLDEPSKWYAHKNMDTANAITYHLARDGDDVIYKVQLIQTRYSKSLEDLFREFDFTVSCFAASATEVRYTRAAGEDLRANRLREQPLGNTQNRPLRVLKHVVYGFDADRKTLRECAQRVSEGGVSWNTDY